MPTTRRRMLFALGAAALAPRIARAQPPAIARIAWLNAASAERQSDLYDAFRDGLRELGYVEGRNLVIEARWANGKGEDLPRLAAELAALKPDVIVAAASAPIAAAQHATSTIPIVMAQGSNVVGQGFVASLARPGRNVTGISTQFEDVFPKWLEVLNSVLPPRAPIAVLGSPANPMTPVYRTNLERIAKALQTPLLAVEARGAAELDGAFLKMRKSGAAAVMVLPDPVYVDQGALLAAQAAKNSLPAMYSYSEIVDRGGLMSYGVKVSESFRRAATYVDKILRGVDPATLPVEQAVKLEFVVNLKAARALGIRFPQAILVRADRVIE